MKKYQTQSLINENAAERALLDNLFNFYVQKYGNTSVEETEKHFLIALGSLVERGEISEDTVVDFLDDKGIEGQIPKSKHRVEYRDRDTYNDGGCGYIGRSYRSSC